jgi:hypothetical protein
MAKKEKVIYDPGELDKVRNRLGVTDIQEARRMASVLGGEVGVERGKEKDSSTKTPPAKKSGPVTGQKRTGRRQLEHRIELAVNEDETANLKKAAVHRPADPADDPLVPVKAAYLERVKMDRLCAQPEFRIKSATQLFMTMLSIFSEPSDLVNPAFVNKWLNNYYKKLERLVTSIRTLFPRNNMKRNEQLKQLSSFAYDVLDTLRYWNLEKMASEMAKIQAHPRNVTVSELSSILKVVYRPLFILECLETDEHIKGVFKLLYKVLYLENPVDAKEKALGLIHEVLFSFNETRQDTHYYLYPLLMKLLSDKFIPYENFFFARRNRFMNFIEASEADQINPARIVTELRTGKDIGEGERKESEEDSGDPEQLEDKEKESPREEKEHRALLQGVASLELLFPKAGWDRLSDFPDIYPYFRKIYSFTRSYELISPTDPLLQAVVIMRILEDLFLGLRNVHFGTVVSAEGGPVQVNEILNKVFSSWQGYIDLPLEKEYLSRLSEYCRILEQSPESRNSNYAKRLLCEMHWIKRLFFFPYYKFDNLFPPPFQKKDIESAYPAIRSLRRGLTLIAVGIEHANRIGGAEKMVPCDGIDNPWESYEFAIPNPVSIHLNALLPPKKQNNAMLIFFSLAFSTVLDHLVNNENSWAYNENNHTLFRGLNGAPQPEKIDADALFKESLRLREK